MFLKKLKFDHIFFSFSNLRILKNSKQAVNRAKDGKKRACSYLPSPKMNEKWASEHTKNESFVRMVDTFDSRNKRDETQVSARQEIHEMMTMVEEDGGALGVMFISMIHKFSGIKQIVMFSLSSRATSLVRG